MAQMTLIAWGKVTTIEYPDTGDELIPGAFGHAYGYDAVVFDDDENEVPNPQSLEEFTIQKILDYVGDITRSHGIHFLVAQARAEAESEVESSLDQISVDIADEE